MNADRLKYLLDRYLNDKATDHELQEYDAWFEQLLRESVPDDLQDPQKIKELKSALLQEIMHRINQQDTEEPVHRGFSRFLPWAAAILVLIATGGYYLVQPAKNKHLTEIQSRNHAVLSKEIVVKNMGDSSRLEVLPDGSTVVLFAGTEIRYPHPFEPFRRDIQLRGKALFNVHKDSVHPFTVYSDSIATTALGTSFTVTAYKGNDIRVSLHEGKVVVKAMFSARQSAGDVFLSPGQAVIYSKDSRSMVRVESGDNNNTSGAKPRLKPSYGARKGFAIYFEDASLKEVLRRLEEGYSVSINFNSNDMESKLFTGHIRETDSLGQVLQRIAALHGLNIKVTPKGYRIQ